MTFAFLSYVTPLRRPPRTHNGDMCPWRTSTRACVTETAGKRTIVYGEALIDLHEIVPGANVKDTKQWREYTGGAPFNLACALAKLGHKVKYLGTLGYDERGDKLMNELKDSGVCVDNVERITGHPTRGVYVRYNKGEPTFAGYSADGAMCADAQRLQFDNDATIFDNVNAFALGTLALASTGSAQTQRYLCSLARSRNTPIMVDVNWRPVFWSDSQAGVNGARDVIMQFLRENATFVKASVDDLSYLMGDEVENDANLLLSQFGELCKGVLVTDGEHGTKYAFKGDGNVVVGSVDAFLVDGGAVDCVGAGDAFFAGFIAESFRCGGLNALKDARMANRICRFAAAVAHFVVAEKGAVAPQPSRQVVEKFLDNSNTVLN